MSVLVIANKLPYILIYKKNLHSQVLNVAVVTITEVLKALSSCRIFVLFSGGTKVFFSSSLVTFRLAVVKIPLKEIQQ